MEIDSMMEVIISYGIFYHFLSPIRGGRQLRACITQHIVLLSFHVTKLSWFFLSYLVLLCLTYLGLFVLAQHWQNKTKQKWSK